MIVRWPSSLAASPVIRLLLFTAAACLVALLSYRYFFPGYLHPLAIYHDDHFIYQGMAARGFGMWIYFTRYPRPIAHVLVDLCGRLGPYRVLAPVFACCFLNAGLVAAYLERLLDRRIGLGIFVLFAALCYGNPEFYVHIKADPFSIFALTFFLITLHLWQSFVTTGARAYLAAFGIAIALLALTKESYFVPLGLFFVMQCVVMQQRRVAAILAATWCALCFAWALYRDSTVWVALSSPTSAATYHADLTAQSLYNGILTLAAYVVSPGILIALAGILLLAWFRSRRAFGVALAAVLFGIASWLANATLPHHLEPQYSCLAIYFLFAPILLIPQLLPARVPWIAAVFIAGLALYVFTLQTYGTPLYADAGWVKTQEQYGMHMMAALERIKKLTRPGESSLVSGITAPYNPFRTPTFITYFFGHDRYWTAVVPDDLPAVTDGSTRLVHSSDPARVQHYAHWFAFTADDRLDKIVDRPTLPAIAPEDTAPQIAQALALNGVPFGEVAFFAAPNPARALDGDHAQTTLHWQSPAAQVQVRLGAPDGKLFAAGTGSGAMQTGPWVTPGMQFYLQDSAWGSPTDASHTIARLHVQVAH